MDFQTCEKLFVQLKDSYPQNLEFKNGRAISYERLGDNHRFLGNLEIALSNFEQYNNWKLELYSSHSQNVELKKNLAISYQLLGWLYENNLKENGKA